MKSILILFSLFICSIGYPQVGINTSSPKGMLDVDGNVKLDGKLFLEAPGDFNTIRGSKLLVNTVSNTVLQYNIDISRYGPINYALFAFKNVNSSGLQNYDTKISSKDYLVTVQGYYFTGPNNSPNIMPHGKTNNMDIPGFQMYAYVNAATQTWFLKGFFNDADFRSPVNGIYANVQTDIYLNLLIFRNGFISKAKTDVIVNMNQQETITVPLPEGF